MIFMWSLLRIQEINPVDDFKAYLMMICCPLNKDHYTHPSFKSAKYRVCRFLVYVYIPVNSADDGNFLVGMLHQPTTEHTFGVLFHVGIHKADVQGPQPYHRLEYTIDYVKLFHHITERSQHLLSQLWYRMASIREFHPSLSLALTSAPLSMRCLTTSRSSTSRRPLL